MSQYACKFVVINTMPANTESADSLSIQMNKEFGNNEWALVNVTPITSANPPGMLLVFQKEIIPN